MGWINPSRALRLYAHSNNEDSTDCSVFSTDDEIAWI